MHIIDLSQPIYSGMPVFPGDPEALIEQVQTFAKDGWNMKRIHINLHDGTHVNVSIHGTNNGSTLDAYVLNDFIGPSVLYKNRDDIKTGVGVVFTDQNIDWKIAKLIVEQKPKFVGLSAKFEFAVDVEKYLLEKGIISFERLANTQKLPPKFEFYGVPLNIKETDGSPVRAFAIIE